MTGFHRKKTGRRSFWASQRLPECLLHLEGFGTMRQLASTSGESAEGSADMLTLNVCCFLLRKIPGVPPKDP